MTDNVRDPERTDRTVEAEPPAGAATEAGPEYGSVQMMMAAGGNQAMVGLSGEAPVQKLGDDDVAPTDAPYIPKSHEEGAAELRKIVPKNHMVFDQLAHDMAYCDSLSADQRHDLTAWGYMQVAPSVSGANDFEMTPFRPDPARADDPYVKELHGGAVKPVLAMRGSASLTDVTTDFEKGGVGRSQWLLNEGAIVTHASHLAGMGPVVATGHSLGGALAQLTAALHPNLISEVVTFQSPGIPAELVEKLSAHNAQAADEDKVGSSHYQIAGDIADEAGERLTPGQVVNIDVDEDGLVDSHTGMISESITGPGGTPYVGADPKHGGGEITPGELENSYISGGAGDQAIESVKVMSSEEYDRDERNGTVEALRKQPTKNRGEMDIQGDHAAHARGIIEGLERWSELHRYLLKAEVDKKTRRQIIDTLTRSFYDLWLADNLIEGRFAADPSPLIAVQTKFESSRSRPMMAGELDRTTEFLSKHGTPPGPPRGAEPAEG
ncbi:MAG: hypothetical protein ACI9MR_000076 [Myxococcota bacterium]|jgi:hypothetical protein